MHNRSHRFRFHSPMPGSLDSLLSTPHVHGGNEMSQTQGSSQFTSEDILGPCDRGWGGLNKRGYDVMVCLYSFVDVKIDGSIQNFGKFEIALSEIVREMVGMDIEYTTYIQYIIPQPCV